MSPSAWALSSRYQSRGLLMTQAGALPEDLFDERGLLGLPFPDIFFLIFASSESVILLQVLPKYIMRNCYSLWPRILTKLDRTNKVATQSRNVFQSMPCPNSPGTPACRIHAHQNVGSPSAGGEDKTNI